METLSFGIDRAPGVKPPGYAAGFAINLQLPASLATIVNTQSTMVNTFPRL
jgi:hypothetical protein